MNWNEHFKLDFFYAWDQADLPDYQVYLDSYLEMRERVDFVHTDTNLIGSKLPHLQENQLQSVYGFGSMMGRIFADILDLNMGQISQVRDWSGRFNLAISLFDYICDETDQGLDRVRSLEAFSIFGSSTALFEFEPNLIEKYLNTLTLNILSEVSKDGFRQSKLIRDMLEELFSAQVELSRSKLGNLSKMNRIPTLLKLKSSGPFEVMALYALGFDQKVNDVKSNKIRKLAGAIGNCFWIVDDAKDLIIDLKAQQWNHFLHEAIQIDKEILNEDLQRSNHEAIVDLLIKNNSASKSAQEIIIALKETIETLDIPKHRAHEIYGLVASASWQWLNY